MVLWLCATLIVGTVPAPSYARTPNGSAASLEQDAPGCGISPADAVRFLEQATFGPWFATDRSDPSYLVSVAHLLNDFPAQMCFEGWLREQFSAPVLVPDDPSAPNLGTNYNYPGDPGTCDDPPAGAGSGICWSPANAPGSCTNGGANTCNRDNYTAYLLQSQFFNNALTQIDQLRQRVAWALTQIDVVSEVDAGIRPASWFTPYLQLFDRDAFGNYRQLLYDLTVNTAMGEYLNMRGNTKTNVNENYAREILQLFSIGLNELNDDGTLQLDGGGNAIPTYTQEIITAFARVFTGWREQPQFSPGITNYRDPMYVPNENNHDSNDKTLLDGLVVNASAANELNTALDNIFNHRNGGMGGVGTFIGKQLIQKMVTSNPGAAYVQNVTSAFNSGCYTGPQGTLFGSPSCNDRGNMQAVVAAVLLDPEARTAPAATNLTYGHLREPALFITNTLRALGGVFDANGNYTTDSVLGDQFLPSGAGTNVRMDQDVFRPATVFSYFPPDNQLPGGSGLIAPEFGIESTSTSLAHINIIYDFAYNKLFNSPSKDHPTPTHIDTTPFEPEACVGDTCDASALIDDLNLRLMHGNMTQNLHDIVLNAVQNLPTDNPTARVQEAIYLIASSHQYQVER